MKRAGLPGPSYSISRPTVIRTAVQISFPWARKTGKRLQGSESASAFSPGLVLHRIVNGGGCALSSRELWL